MNKLKEFRLEGIPVFHVIQLLVKLLLHVEGSYQTNSRLASSIFIGGVWLILIGQFSPSALTLAGLVFLGGWVAWASSIPFHSPEDLEMAGKTAKRNPSMLWR